MRLPLIELNLIFILLFCLLKLWNWGNRTLCVFEREKACLFHQPEFRFNQLFSSINKSSTVVSGMISLAEASSRKWLLIFNFTKWSQARLGTFWVMSAELWSPGVSHSGTSPPYFNDDSYLLMSTFDSALTFQLFLQFAARGNRCRPRELPVESLSYIPATKIIRSLKNCCMKRKRKNSVKSANFKFKLADEGLERRTRVLACSEIQKQISIAKKRRAHQSLRKVLVLLWIHQRFLEPQFVVRCSTDWTMFKIKGWSA